MTEAVLNRQSLRLKNKTSDASKLADFFVAYVTSLALSDEAHNDLRLVIEETFINIVSYAYTETGDIDIELTHSETTINISFTDTGIAFNPLADAEKFKDTDDHCEGGMGITLITSLTDAQQYNRVGQSNVFTLTKHYTK